MDEDYIPSGASSNTNKVMEREPKDVKSKRKNRTKPQKDNFEGERQPKDVKSKRKNRTKPQQDNSEGSTQVNETIEDSNAENEPNEGSNAENEPNEGSTDQNEGSTDQNEGSIEAAQDQEQDNQKSMSLEVKHLTVFDIFQFLFQSSFANTARNHTKVELHWVTTYQKLPVETNIPYSLLQMSTLTKP